MVSPRFQERRHHNHDAYEVHGESQPDQEQEDLFGIQRKTHVRAVSSVRYEYELKLC